METLFGIMPSVVEDIPPCKSIFDPGMARKLIQSGCILYDIKPHRDNAAKTVFVFKVNAHFERCLEELRRKGGERSGIEE